MAKHFYRNRNRQHRNYKKKSSAAFPTPVLLALALAAFLAFQYYQTGWEQLAFWIGTVAIVLFISIGGFSWWRWSQSRRRKKALQLADIDEMNGIAFEHYVADLLRSQGYTDVRVTPDQNDFGADILFADGETTYAAQVKRYRGFVGVEALYQAAGGRDYYGRQRAAVITNSRFSTQALELASKTGMLLVDRQLLTDWIVAFQDQK